MPCAIVVSVIFAVLFVCTGNVCRSPVAERLFLARLAPGAPVTASSAGAGALEGYGIDGPSAAALRELGADPAGHQARSLTESMVAEANLILTAQTAHRGAVLQANPTAMRRTFTLREFGRLAAALPSPRGLPALEGLRARVSEVADQRGVVSAGQPRGDDIGDPFGASFDIARACAAQVGAAVDAVLDTLGVRGSVAAGGVKGEV